jgi:hypothetical protein
VLSLSFLALCYDLAAGKIGPDHVFLWRQDLPVVAAETVGFILTFALFARRRLTASALALKPWMVWAAAAFVLVSGALGVSLVFDGYGVSADEFLADFDAKIFSSGSLAARIPETWRAYAPALQPKFMVISADHSTWSSGYLPVNAMFRALAEAVHLRPLLNPAFSAASVLLTWAIGRDLWPAHPRRAIAAALLMAASSQLIVMSMTAWATPAHLALNSLWLWLFLRRRLAADLAAISVSALATGLHQAIFHPLFVLPFMVELFLERRWGRAISYLLALGLITFFWLEYWRLTVGLTAGLSGGPTPSNPAMIFQRTGELLGGFKVSALGLIASNLLRFLAWQNPMTIPLAMLGIAVALRKPGPFRAMAFGVCLAVPVFLMLVPTQTHGWGYRYLHGYVGVLALLAVQGWSDLTQAADAGLRDRSQTLLATFAAVSFALLLPTQAWLAHRFTQPYASAHRAIQRTPADVVLVDNLLIGFDGGGLVRNDPFLTNRPKVMLLASLSEQQQAELCRRAKIAILDANHPSLSGVTTWSGLPEASGQARALFATGRCSSL